MSHDDPFDPLPPSSPYFFMGDDALNSYKDAAWQAPNLALRDAPIALTPFPCV